MLNILLMHQASENTNSVARAWYAALKTVSYVKTIGYPEEILQSPMAHPNLVNDSAFSVDIKLQVNSTSQELIGLIGEFKLDLYLWIGSGSYSPPSQLDQIACPKAGYLIGAELELNDALKWASHFDIVVVSDLVLLERLCSAGIKANWLPLACDALGSKTGQTDSSADMEYCSALNQTPVLASSLKQLADQFKLRGTMTPNFDESDPVALPKAVLQHADTQGSLRMEFFEAMSRGVLVMADCKEGSGQNILFEPHYHYALYDSANLVEVASYYLKTDLALQSVARAGMALVQAGHTYQHRVNHFLDLAERKISRTFSAHEWRDFASAQLAKSILLQSGGDGKEHSERVKLIDRHSVARSFIIPVLDYSPASPYNIKTLLNDLAQIGGEVIIIFNSETVANEIKNHPRINHYAVLKENIGVARAWNMGLDLCRTDIAFIFNADLHISKQVVDQMQSALEGLPHAAIVGPQGSYFNFEQLKDYFYLDKGKFHSIMEVDAVSGFLFAVKTAPFKEKQLQFENNFTPCYFEEWDLGLQIRAAGLKAYAVPIKEYEHEWSGSIRSYRQIHYYDRAQTAKQIQMRNAYLFQEKWRRSSIVKKNPQFLRSTWFSILVKQLEIAIAGNHKEHAQNFLGHLEAQFPGEFEIGILQARYKNQFQDNYS